MNRRTIRIIIALATLSLVGIVATQLFWVKNAYNLQEKQFNERVHVALTNVTHELLNINHDKSELINPVKQISSNYFAVLINDTVHPFLLQTLIKKEFLARNLYIDFEYVIYDCFTDSIVFGEYISLKEETKDQLQSKAFNIKWDGDGHYFGVYFPTKRFYIANEMGIWIFSSIVILIIVIFFAYTITVILKQKRLSEIKNDFINNITHEFKTPISTISLSSEVLLNDDIVDEPSRLKKYVKIIRQENNRLKKQVDKVLQLATLEKDQLKLENEDLNINELIETSIAVFKVLIEEKKGEIVYTLSDRVGTFYGDKTHLTNIVHSLVDNALKYTKSEPRIAIETKVNGDWLQICVKDNGVGISKADQKYIFDKFYRVPTGDHHDVKGFGLGLHYVKTIVEAYNGNVKLISEENQGTTFIVQLPMR